MTDDFIPLEDAERIHSEKRANSSTEWPDLKPLPSGLRPVKPFAFGLWTDVSHGAATQLTVQRS
jgi:hypothetical protein